MRRASYYIEFDDELINPVVKPAVKLSSRKKYEIDSKFLQFMLMPFFPLLGISMLLGGKLPKSMKFLN